VAVAIHESAVVHPKARLGVDVTIGPLCVVEEDVELGDRTRLDAQCQVKRYTRMGPDNHIHSLAVVGGQPQHIGFQGEETWVEMGASNTVREFVTIHRGTAQGRERTVLGSGCLLMAYVHVAHDCLLGDGVIMANASSLAGHVDMGDGCIISGMSGVHQYVRIGEYAFLGAMSGIGLDIPPYTLASGVRSVLHGVNLIGLRRNGFSREVITALKNAYQIVFRSGRIREEALAEVEAKFSVYPEVRRFAEFLRQSTRGVTPDSGGAAEREAPSEVRQ
jgi:UDP-N-acetylglucosamine acyltransferase